MFRSAWQCPHTTGDCWGCAALVFRAISLAEIAELTTCADSPNRGSSHHFRRRICSEPLERPVPGRRLAPCSAKTRRSGRCATGCFRTNIPKPAIKKPGFIPCKPIEITWVCVLNSASSPPPQVRSRQRQPYPHTPALNLTVRAPLPPPARTNFCEYLYAYASHAHPSLPQ